jgi:predicted P-loop ATPase
MFNEKLVRAAKKEIVDKYADEFLLSKLINDEKYVYDNPSYNFYFIKFNNVLIHFTSDEDIYYSDDDIRINIKSNKIETIYRWLKLTKKKFSVTIEDSKIERIIIDLNYNKNDMKILFQILDFMKLFYKKYDNIGENI